MPLLPNYSLRDLRLVDVGRYLPIKGLHWLVLGVSLVITLIAWQASLRELQERHQFRFDRQADYAVSLFEQQMNRYATLLNASAGFVAANDSISPEQWQEFTDGAGLDEHFPAIKGLGVVYRIEHNKLGEFIQQQRLTRPDFTFHTPVDMASVQGIGYVLPVTLIMPQSLEKRVLGLNLARDSKRNEAIQRSIQTGTLQITAPTQAVAVDGPGLVMISPIFKSARLDTEALRQAHFEGAIVAAITTSKFATGILDSDMRQVAIKVTDGDDILYNELVSENKDIDLSPLVTGSRAVSLFGREWQFELHTTQSYRRTQNSQTPNLILAGGLIIDALILLLFLFMSQANKKATAFGKTISLMYEQQSVELRKSYQALEERNEQLESFSYVVSHDLKAPLRGISTLTEFIDEDIDEIYGDAPNTPVIKDHCSRINDQVRLAQNLIRGVLEYSGLGADVEHAEAVDVQELLRSLQTTLMVDNAQLNLVGIFPTLDTYRTQLTQVFMNLISNAYKYHDGEEMAIVTVGVQASHLSNFYRFTVTDNGPGIDPAYHQKIFEPFSTLQPKDHSMSSGVGLAIVHKLVTSHGGAIEVSNNAGRGACFSFDWPCSVTDEPGNSDDSEFPLAA